METKTSMKICMLNKIKKWIGSQIKVKITPIMKYGKVNYLEITVSLMGFRLYDVTKPVNKNNTIIL